MHKSVIVFFLFLNTLISIILYYEVTKKSRNKYFNSKINRKYGLNNKYLINNNVAQYSSFLVIDQDDSIKTEYRIEAYINLNYKYVERFGPKENFICLIKFIDNLKMTEKIIEVESTESFRNSKEIYFKKVFFLNMENFKTDLEIFTIEYLLKNIYVAVIWKNDYDKSLDVDSFMRTLDELKPNKTAVFPYSFIKFQKPSIIKNIQPRLKSIGVCVHYTYQIPAQIFDWIDIQFEIGIAEIMFYDAIENNNLTKLLKRKYGNDSRLVVRPYDIDFNDLCEETTLFEQFTESINLPLKIKDYMKKSCIEFFEFEFVNKYEWRLKQEKITSNDCFTVLSQKHEFIGYYDLDEFVFPRTLGIYSDFYDKQKYYTCKNSSKSICDLNPFHVNNSVDNKMYNYFHSIIEEYRNNRNMDDFIAIYFFHALFLTADEVEAKLIKKLGSIIHDTNTEGKEIHFPLRFDLPDPVRNTSRRFIIKDTDVDYVKYLYKSYKSFIPCIYNENLKHIKSLDISLLRHLYFLTEDLERLGKTFVYYKNIVALTPHGAEFDKTKWWIIVPKDKGYLSHFRDTLKIKNFTGPIIKLSFDSEYVFYLLKKYSNYCQIKI